MNSWPPRMSQPPVVLDYGAFGNASDRDKLIVACILTEFSILIHFILDSVPHET